MVYDTLGSHANDWAGKTHAEVNEIARKLGSILVVPIGSLEQHGHHLPTATDTILCDAVAHLGVKRANEEVPVLVTPPVWTGISPHHLEIGATISLEIHTMLALLEEITASSLENGFDAILFLNGHGGNISTVSAMTAHLSPRYPNVDVLGLTYWFLAEPYMDEIRKSERGGFGHGGEFETSLMLHLCPELVDEEAFEAHYADSAYDLGFKDMFVRGPLAEFEPAHGPMYSEGGTRGDPTLASAETGERVYDLLGDELAMLLEEIHETNRSSGDSSDSPPH